MKVKQICFGVLRINPDDFRRYRIDDLWLTISGWDEEVMFNLRVNKTLTAIIAETTNRSMGGKGVIDYINKVIPLDEKEEVKDGLTPDQITATLKHYQEMREKRRIEQEKKKNG